MIQNRKYRILCDPRAKITSGEKTEEGRPKGLPYFDISKFPELIKAYGEQPEELYLYFPSDNIPDFFNDEYNLYGSNEQKKRSCDGITCIHRIKETINEITYEPGQESPCVCKDLSDKDKNKCSYVMYLKAWIALPDTWKIENPLCYLFRTHSKNSGDSIYSELEKIKTLAGGILRGIKFQINVRMVASKDDAKKRFPIWSLQSVGMMSDIREQVTSRAYGIEEEERQAIEQDKKEIEVQKDSEYYLEKIKEILVENHPGKAEKEQAKKKELLHEYFGTSNWKEVEKMPLDVIERSTKKLEKELKDDAELFDEKGKEINDA